MAKNDNELMNKIRENYQSIILGLIVFLIAATAIYRAITTQQKSTEKKGAVSIEEQVDDTGRIVTDVYTVRKGDTLWQIAEMKYGSGYNWVDIAKENKLKNGNQIEKDQNLNLPVVTPKMATTKKVTTQKTEKVTLTGDTYTVQKGDHLWGIAVRAYGDGYQWSAIAKANKIVRPNHITVGQKLTLPRK